MLPILQPTTIAQRRPDSKSLSNHANTTATERQGPVTFFTLPLEIRLVIYGFTFTTSKECTLRRPKDVPPPRRSSKQTLTIFPSSILQTNKTIHTEALPIFYASQTFHYSTELNGLFGQPTIPNAYLGWMKHMSIDVTLAINTLEKIDSVIAIHTQAILKHCSKLSSFTLHIIKAVDSSHLNVAYSLTAKAQRHLLEGASAKLLRTLRSRVQELSIVYLGKWQTLHEFRKAIADDEEWVQADRNRDYGWPALSLTKAQDNAMKARQFSRYSEFCSTGCSLHPDKSCVRVFHCRQAADVRESREGESEVDVDC